MLTYFLALTVPVAAVALLYARWEYRKRGKLTFFGVFLLCAMLFIPNLVLEYATTYEMLDTLLDYFGVAVSVVGIAICVISIAHFRSISKVFCVDAGKLTISGPYRCSRNPQYVGYFLFLLGFALNDWSAWCLVALLVAAISLHFLALMEEEHLRRVFGEQYHEAMVYHCRMGGRASFWGVTRFVSDPVHALIWASARVNVHTAIIGSASGRKFACNKAG